MAEKQRVQLTSTGKNIHDLARVTMAEPYMGHDHYAEKLGWTRAEVDEALEIILKGTTLGVRP